MDYTALTPPVKKKLFELIKVINNPEVAPETRQYNLEIALRQVGTSVYNKIFDMNAWDMEIADAIGDGIPDEMIYGLAKSVSDSVVLGNKSEIDALIEAFINNAVSMAQKDAHKLAREAGKRPEIRRSVTHMSACRWCYGLDTRGNWIADPDPDLFRRHAHCTCVIETRGWKSRNGVLDNYVKPSSRR